MNSALAGGTKAVEGQLVASHLETRGFHHAVKSRPESRAISLGGAPATLAEDVMVVASAMAPHKPLDLVAPHQTFGPPFAQEAFQVAVNGRQAGGFPDHPPGDLIDGEGTISGLEHRQDGLPLGSLFESRRPQGRGAGFVRGRKRNSHV